MSYPQWDQWVSTLEQFVPPIFRPSITPHVILGDDEDIFSGISMIIHIEIRISLTQLARG